MSLRSSLLKALSRVSCIVSKESEAFKLSNVLDTRLSRIGERAASTSKTSAPTSTLWRTLRGVRCHTNSQVVQLQYHRINVRGYRQQWGGRQGYVRFGSGGKPSRVPYWLQDRRNQRFVIIAGAGLGIIYISSRQEIPYTHRYHSVLVDVETEKLLGEQTFKQILMEAKMSGKLLSPGHPASRMVQRVGKRIAAVASDNYGGGFNEQMKGMNWEFAVIRSPEVNAFVVPGGKVVVYSGLLNIISSEDELAAVLAHEVAHVVARHAAERMTQGSVVELIRMIAYLGFGIPLFSGPIQALFFLPNSRQAETEADTIGVQLAARACYDPLAAASVFQKLGEEEKKAGMSIPAFLRTHPVTEDRVKTIRSMVSKASALSEESGCNDASTFLEFFGK